MVTLLLFNSIANECLPIFLNKLVPEYLSILISVTAVLFFGEIIPSAILSGPNKMDIASFLSPVVRVLFVVFYILARPISSTLD